jgi:hypothetical protein
MFFYIANRCTLRRLGVPANTPIAAGARTALKRVQEVRCPQLYYPASNFITQIQTFPPAKSASRRRR